MSISSVVLSGRSTILTPLNAPSALTMVDLAQPFSPQSRIPPILGSMKGCKSGLYYHFSPVPQWLQRDTADYASSSASRSDGSPSVLSKGSFRILCGNTILAAFTMWFRATAPSPQKAANVCAVFRSE